MAVLMRTLGLLMAVALAAGCRTGPEQWGPFRGQVVDADTGQPIAGAHVAVVWIREPPSLHITQWFYDAQETVTDAEGRFEIPRRTRLLTAWVRGPDVHVFAPRYLWEQAPEVTPADGQPYVDPTVIKVRLLKTPEEQCKFRPRELLTPENSAQRYLHAVQEYNLALGC